MWSKMHILHFLLCGAGIFSTAQKCTLCSNCNVSSIRKKRSVCAWWVCFCSIVQSSKSSMTTSSSSSSVSAPSYGSVPSATISGLFRADSLVALFCELGISSSSTMASSTSFSSSFCGQDLGGKEEKTQMKVNKTVIRQAYHIVTYS